MILIGQYDSPFVRRVGIALRLYDIRFEHRPWSAFSDADKLRSLNPLMRVPALVLNEGFVLTDSHMMLDYLDSLVAEPMFPRAEPARHQVLKIAAMATGMAEKAVSLFYEIRMHDQVSAQFVTRSQSQIVAAMATLEADFAARPGPYWFGKTICHADIALTCAWRFITEAHPGLIQPNTYPALAAFTNRLETLPIFKEIAQPFLPPA